MNQFGISYELSPSPSHFEALGHGYIFHVTEEVTSEPVITFLSRNGQLEKQPHFIAKLFDIRGVLAVVLQPYQVIVYKARLFEWEPILPQVELVLREALDPDHKKTLH